MTLKELRPHIEAAGKKVGKSYLQYPAISNIYPTIEKPFVEKFEKLKQNELETFKNFKNKDTHPVYQAVLGKSAKRSVEASSDFSVNQLLKALYILESTEPSDIFQVDNLIVDLFLVKFVIDPSLYTIRKVKKNNPEKITLVREISKFFFESCILHRFGLKSQDAFYNSASVLTDGDAPAVTHPETPYLTDFDITVIVDMYNNDISPNSTIELIFIHEALHRVSTKHLDGNPYGFLDDHGYFPKQLKRMDFENHLKNAHSFTLLSERVAQVRSDVAEEVRVEDKYFSFEVLEGDNLWNLSYRWLGKGVLWPELWELNKNNLRSGKPELIYPKETIKVPYK